MASMVASSHRKKALKGLFAAPVRVSSPHMAVVPTAWGGCGIVWKNHVDEGMGSGAGFARRPIGVLCRICTPGLSEGKLRECLMKQHPGCSEVLPTAGIFHPDIVPDWFGELVRFLQSYYSAGLRHQTLPEYADHWAAWRSRLDWSQVTPFQREVLEAVGPIPCSRTLTYGQIAAKIGKPNAARAVGAAVGANPWPVLVPCHRVMGAAGKLTGFSAPGGVGAKKRMLELEGGTIF